jgi:hypothetical protein
LCIPRTDLISSAHLEYNLPTRRAREHFGIWF